MTYKTTLRFIFITISLLTLHNQAFSVDKKEAVAPQTPAVTIIPTITCSSELAYKWKRLPPPPLPPDPTKKVKPSGTPEPLDPDLYNLIESPAFSLKESGPIEGEVKARLEAQLLEAKIQAMRLCIEIHQSQGTCLSKKLAAVSMQLERMDFEAKKAIREHSIEDCKSLHGICLSTSSSEITCRQEIVPTPVPTEVPAKDVKKK